MGDAVTLFLRIAGFLLLVCAGAGGGFAAAAQLAENRRQAHTFARLLCRLAELLDAQATAGPELLRRAVRCGEFAAFCPPGAAGLSDLTPPPCLPDALRAEIGENLSAAEESPRPAACAALRRLAALCEEEAAELADRARAARRLWPRLGACLGAMAAILLW